MLISEVYNVNCMEYMKGIPDKFFDLAIVDPPYGIKEDGSKNHTRSKITDSRDYAPYIGNDSKPPDADYFIELFRVSKDQVIWGANHFIDNIPNSHNSSCWIVWDKDNGNNDFADCELAWTSFPCAVRKFKYRWHGMLQENMSNKEVRIHPNQKPVALYAFILNKFAKSGYKILDTHIGSGSSRIAAFSLNMDFYGTELDRYYYDLQEKRFREQCFGEIQLKNGGIVKQLSLF